MMVKKAKCPGCCPDVAGAYFDKEPTWNDADEMIWVWQCRNCFRHIPCGKSRRAGLKGITPSQQRAIDRIRYDMDSMGRHFPGEYEFKRFEISETDYGFVWLHAEYGQVGDEGTAASILCRDNKSLHIGPRGGIKEH